MPMPAKERKLRAVPAAKTAPGAGILLCRVVSREGDRFRVRQGEREWLARCDGSVDPALIDHALVSHARVVVEDDGEPVIVGTLATRRSVEIGRDLCVRVDVDRFEVAVAGEAILKSPSAFVSVKGDEVEIFARRILSRARDLARILARAIQLN